MEEEEETRPRCMCGGLRGGGHGDWDECDCDEKGRAAVAVWRGYRDFFYEMSYRLRAKAGHFFSNSRERDSEFYLVRNIQAPPSFFRRYGMEVPLPTPQPQTRASSTLYNVSISFSFTATSANM